MIRGAFILTADGFYFDYEAPRIETITLNAIARGLANTCRFAGQCGRFYSVAEHSIWVSRLVPAEDAVAGLLHDAAEAFICDMPKPLKEVLPQYKAVEERIERVVLDRFGISALPASVKTADRVMLRTEQLQLMECGDRWEWSDGVTPADITLEILTPEEAYYAFLARCRELAVR